MATRRAKKRKAQQGKRPKPAAKAKVPGKAKGFTGFREGSARAKVWAALSKQLAGGKTVKLADVAKAVGAALKLKAEAAQKQAGLFMWTFLRAELVERVGRGTFAAVAQRKEA